MNDWHLQDEKREHGLKRDAPADGAPVYSAQVGGECGDKAKKEKDAGDSLSARADSAAGRVSCGPDQRDGGKKKNPPRPWGGWMGRLCRGNCPRGFRFGGHLRGCKSCHNARMWDRRKHGSKFGFALVGLSG